MDLQRVARATLGVPAAEVDGLMAGGTFLGRHVHEETAGFAADITRTHHQRGAT